MTDEVMPLPEAADDAGDGAPEPDMLAAEIPVEDVLDQPAVVEFPAEQPVAAPDGTPWWKLLWQMLTGTTDAASRDQQAHDLDAAIGATPDTPANYVLRGELRLSSGDYDGAAADFQRALDLASAEVETQDWGIVAQAVQDRAYAGLKKIERGS